jgi:hypothetical protein
VDLGEALALVLDISALPSHELSCAEEIVFTVRLKYLPFALDAAFHTLEVRFDVALLDVHQPRIVWVIEFDVVLMANRLGIQVQSQRSF